MAPTNNTFVRIYRYMMYFCLLGGYVHPDIDQILQLPKTLRKVLPYLAVPFIGQICVFYTDVIFSLTTELMNPHEGTSIRSSFQHAIQVNNISICLHHVSVIYRNAETITALTRDYNYMIQRAATDKHKLKIAREGSQRLNWIMCLHMLAVIISPTVFQTQFYMMTHRAPYTSSLPWHHQLQLLIFSIITAHSFSLILAAYYYLKMGSLAVLTGELRILRMELREIFLAIYVDTEGLVRISGTNQKFNVKSHSSRLLSMDRCLNDWIKRHCQVFKCCRILNKMLSMAVLLSYQFSAVIVTSLILFTNGMKGKFPLSLAIYAVIQMLTLYAVCNYGASFTQASEEVTADAYYGCDWYAYPIHIQKKLLIIMQISQQRPMSLSTYGIFPLNRETFFSVLNVSYSLLTFLASMAATEE